MTPADVRGVYWRYMPEYEPRNFLNAELPLPQFYWTAETDMNCLREEITQTLDYGHADHIQRLLITCLFALLAGVHLQAVRPMRAPERRLFGAAIFHASSFSVQGPRIGADNRPLASASPRNISVFGSQWSRRPSLTEISAIIPR